MRQPCETAEQAELRGTLEEHADICQNASLLSVAAGETMGHFDIDGSQH